MPYPHIILDEPKNLKKERLTSVKGYWDYTRIDSEIITIDVTDRDDWKTGLGFYFIPTFILLFLPKGSWFEPAFWGPSLPIYIIGTYFILYSLFLSKSKAIILERINDKITVPRFLWMESITFPFSEAHADLVYANISEGIIGSQFNCSHKDNKKKGGCISIHEHEKTWSLYVWYMDKNRPLPPGTAFDLHRQANFERRKTEGFPPPLYKSTIPTPEATEEQQKEREKYWNDEEFMVSNID